MIAEGTNFSPPTTFKIFQTDLGFSAATGNQLCSLLDEQQGGEEKRAASPFQIADGQNSLAKPVMAHLFPASRCFGLVSKMCLSASPFLPRRFIFF